MATEVERNKEQEPEVKAKIKIDDDNEKVSTESSRDKKTDAGMTSEEVVTNDDLNGTQTTFIKQTVEHDPTRSTTTVVKESDIKVELASDDNKTVQIKRETQTITKVNYTTPDVAPVTSSSVVNDVRPVSLSSDDGFNIQDANKLKNGELSPEPMALFGALKYLQEKETKDNNQENAPDSNPVNDIFSNMYKPYDVTSPPPPAPKVASSDVKATPATRPISDVFSKMYDTPENATKSRTITTEKFEKGDTQVMRVQTVSVTSETKQVPVAKETGDSPPPACPPQAPVLNVQPEVSQNGLEAEEAKINRASLGLKSSIEIKHSEGQHEPHDLEPVTNGDESKTRFY